MYNRIISGKKNNKEKINKRKNMNNKGINLIFNKTSKKGKEV